jgi:hypothetical protein
MMDMLTMDIAGYALFLIVGLACGAAVMRWSDQKHCTDCYMQQYADQDGRCPCICHLKPEGKSKVLVDQATGRIVGMEIKSGGAA